MAAFVLYVATMISLMIISFKFINDFGITDKKKKDTAIDVAGLLSVFWLPVVVAFAIWLLFAKKTKKKEEISSSLEEKFSKAFK